MPDRIALAVVRAELRRAARTFGDVDRAYLRNETGFDRDRLERLISAARLDLVAKESVARNLATEGGADGSRVPQLGKG